MKNTILTIMILASITSNAAEIVAHRGDNTLAPENSVEAAKIAWQNGVRLVEGDFFETAEGEIVCIHGRSELKSLGGLDKEIKDLSKSEIKSVNLADNPKWRDKFKTVRIPLMSEMMSAVPEGGVLVFEIKNYSPDYADKVDAARKAAGLSKEQIIFIAFSTNALKDINSKLDGHKTYWLYAPKVVDGVVKPTAQEAIETCKRVGAAGVDVGSTQLLGADYINAIKNAGLEFWVWTVNSEDEFKRLEKLGVDGITTDKASAFLKLKNKK